MYAPKDALYPDRTIKANTTTLYVPIVSSVRLNENKRRMTAPTIIGPSEPASITEPMTMNTPDTIRERSDASIPERIGPSNKTQSAINIPMMDDEMMDAHSLFV